jgi:hypothetical protein
MWFEKCNTEDAENAEVRGCGGLKVEVSLILLTTYPYIFALTYCKYIKKVIVS